MTNPKVYRILAFGDSLTEVLPDLHSLHFDEFPFLH